MRSRDDACTTGYHITTANSSQFPRHTTSTDTGHHEKVRIHRPEGLAKAFIQRARRRRHQRDTPLAKRDISLFQTYFYNVLAFKISINKNKNEKDSFFKDISEIEYFNYGELDHYTKKYPNLRKKKLKKG